LPDDSPHTLVRPTLCHVFFSGAAVKEDVDGRNKSGHDEKYATIADTNLIYAWQLQRHIEDKLKAIRPRVA
jgi:hypothetical protein